MTMRVVLLVLVAAFSSPTWAIRSGVSIPESYTCSHINEEYTACQLEIMCNLCISTSSCEFNADDLSCVTRSSSTNSTTSYCDSDDGACAVCVATAADPICNGQDGVCICPSLCSAVEPAEESGCSSEDSFLLYVGLSSGMTCLGLLVFVALKFKRRRAEVAWQNAMATHRHLENEMLRSRQPQLALNLVGWRDTVELDKPQLHKLGACSYVNDHGERTTDELGPSTSMETSSTISGVAGSPQSNAAASERECNSDSDPEGFYSAMNDTDGPSAGDSSNDKSR